VRQGGDGHYEVGIDKRVMDAMGPGEHVLLITFRQGTVSATIDGNPCPVQTVKNPTSGAFHFSPSRGRLVVRSIEYRP